ncbi:hypothetical protein LCGC14_1796680, partial [marine sediment metagenome]
IRSEEESRECLCSTVPPTSISIDWGGLRWSGSLCVINHCAAVRLPLSTSVFTTRQALTTPSDSANSTPDRNSSSFFKCRYNVACEIPTCLEAAVRGIQSATNSMNLSLSSSVNLSSPGCSILLDQFLLEQVFVTTVLGDCCRFNRVTLRSKIFNESFCHQISILWHTWFALVVDTVVVYTHTFDDDCPISHDLSLNVDRISRRADVNVSVHDLPCNRAQHTRLFCPARVAQAGQMCQVRASVLRLISGPSGAETMRRRLWQGTS